jgi:hypothetical protein
MSGALRGARSSPVKQWALKAMAEVSARDHSLWAAKTQVRAFLLREAAYRTVDDDTFESVRASLLAIDEAIEKIDAARHLVWANRFAVECTQ